MTNTATIQINGKEIGESRINPYIFGHFVEDIRDHMDAMLAYTVKCMDFQEEDKIHKGVSGPWYPITNGANTVYALHPAAPKHSGHSQKVGILSDDHCFAGIGQKISVQGGTTYTGKLVARASAEVKIATIEIVDFFTKQTLGKTQVEFTSHNWRDYHFELIAERDCIQAEFRILISSEHDNWLDSISTGTLWLDHVSLISGDRIGLVKKKVFEMTQDLNPGMMRIGGNYMSAYHWDHGVGPQLERPDIVNEAWQIMAHKYFGTDEFLQYCEDLQVEPLMGINDGSGTPEEAAAWVEYCNGSVETPMGKLRAKYGRTEPYGVKYWEIGNEVWGPWQVGHCTAEQFAKRFLLFADAMKAADPSIKILACGHTDANWNKTVLEVTKGRLDYLTMHIYQGYGRYGLVDGDFSREDKYHAIVSYPEFTRESIKKTEKLINSHDHYRHVKLAITEHNTMYYNNKLRKGLPNEHTLEAAVANAGNLNEMIRNAHLVEIGSFSDLVNGWLGGCIRVGDHYADQVKRKVPGWSGQGDVIYGTPTYHMMKLFASRDITHVVDHHVQCDTFSVNAPYANDTFKELPVLDIVSCVNEARNKLTCFVVNRGLVSVEATFSIQHLVPDHTVKVFEITSDDWEDINDVFTPEKVTTEQSELTIQGQQFAYTLQAHSIYVFEVTI